MRLCRDCLSIDTTGSESGPPCGVCGSARVIGHGELESLAIAHIDCDSFYASVEKRDDPGLAGKPVIVGGGRRGVVLAACYIARRFGVRSAMPMFKALKACPDAVVIRPHMEKYARVGREVKALMRDLTPLVEPISIDEAFLDLSGTDRLHGGCPARTLAGFAQRIESILGITVSVGLSHNKFLAKLASGLGKPSGFIVVGRAETLDFLDGKPVALMWGVGPVLEARLTADGITRIGQLRSIPEAELVRRYGDIGRRLSRFSRGEDRRPVIAGGRRKSLSAETTFPEDIGDAARLRQRLWPLCEKVAAGLRKEGIAGSCVTLKLKTATFRLRTRSTTLSHPTLLAETIYRAGEALLTPEADGTPFRLVGIGVSRFAAASQADPPDLADPAGPRRRALEETMDVIRSRFGSDAISKGRGLE